MNTDAQESWRKQEITKFLCHEDSEYLLVAALLHSSKM